MTSNPEVPHRIAYGHLNRQTWRASWEGAINRVPACGCDPIPIARILAGDAGFSGGVVGHAGNPKSSPAIIVHNRPPNQIEVRLRWLGAKVDYGDDDWRYAPDVADMMLDYSVAFQMFAREDDDWTEALLAWLRSWAAVQDWGKEPVVRD